MLLIFLLEVQYSHAIPEKWYGMAFISADNEKRIPRKYVICYALLRLNMFILIMDRYAK
ncbi:hypothetical protein bsdcttw_01920 [Anaerocolumna chitinilytica]|uniref:Uncharacterized protein n=1 Tax=Anaerocolumna chitinilytica TaxID=1727145 RepID=A0A7I8DIS4_9FIRM|nr:hypothetical protein bsdcttw_01920 [Anaerocolumna chitinilytica]